ncbi:hypothetical protein ACMFMG_009221 [Clarireedia jacksonii]
MKNYEEMPKMNMKKKNEAVLTYDCVRQEKGHRTSTTIGMEELCLEVPPELLVVFLPSEQALHLQGLDQQLSDRFSIPESLWSPTCHEASGFFKCQEDRNKDDVLESHTTLFRVQIKEPRQLNAENSIYRTNEIIYTWHMFTFLTYWTPENKVVVLCFDLPAQFKNNFVNLLSTPSTNLDLRDPYSIHVLLMWELTKLFDLALWAARDLVRGLEKNRTSSEDPRPDYTRMHELARHTIHASEMLEITLETLTAMIQEHDALFDGADALGIKSKTLSRQTGRDLKFQSTMLKGFHLRSKALEERLRNEISLAFSTVSQYDSRITVQISEAMRIDSFTMRNAATLGLLFLPGTFVCAIFSTSFFNFSPDNNSQTQRWIVSEKFWIYWAVTLPLTTVTVLVWILWHRLCRESRRIRSYWGTALSQDSRNDGSRDV